MKRTFLALVVVMLGGAASAADFSGLQTMRVADFRAALAADKTIAAPLPQPVAEKGAAQSGPWAAAAEELGMNPADIEMRTVWADPDGKTHLILPTECGGSRKVVGAGGLLGAVKRAKEILAGQGVDVARVAVYTAADPYADLTTSARGDSDIKKYTFKESNAPVTVGKSSTRARMEKKINELLASGAVVTQCEIFAPTPFPTQLVVDRYFFVVEYLK
ncbi:MAG: hypothetical protein NTY45_00920 [Elusimicrobia bacterium]|nr:hypothetical protein [Elusimicrobiota bacterium]